MKRALILGLAFCLPAIAAPAGDSGPPADVLAVRNVEITSTAGSVLPERNLDLMMSIYADDAVLTDTAHDNKVYKGKDQVRSYWGEVRDRSGPSTTGSGNTPAMRIRSQVKGDTATLYFECLWVDADANAIGAHSFSDMTLARVRGHWLVKDIKVGKIDKL